MEKLKKEEETICRGLLNLNKANDITTVLCVALFTLLRDKDLVSESEVTKAIEGATEKVSKIRLQVLEAMDKIAQDGSIDASRPIQ